MGEYSTQNHGSLTFDLDLPWFSLLDPLPDETPPASLARWAEETPPGSDTPKSPLSLDAYLNLCRDQLGMSEREVSFNSQLYHLVEEGGERGRGEEELRSLLPLPPSSSLSLADHIQCLLNFEMVGGERVKSKILCLTHFNSHIFLSLLSGCQGWSK